MAINRYLSMAAGETQRKYEADGISTPDLEKRVFGGSAGMDAGMVNIRQMEREVQRYEQEIERITLEQYPTLVQPLLQGLQRIGVPVVEFSNRRQTRQLEGVVQNLGERRGKYEQEIVGRQKEVTKYRELRDSAGLLLQRYHAQLVDMKTVLEQKRADYRTAIAEATKTDSKAYLTLRMEVSNLGNDILEVSRKRERAASKVVEVQRNIELLTATQNQMHALLQKVQEAELRAKRSLGEARIVDGSKELSLPKTVGDIAQAEVTGYKVRQRTGKVDAVVAKTVEAIHSYDHAFGEQERDREQDAALRQRIEEKNDAFLDEALRIAENPGETIH